jgi:ABC-type nitrate/sulfonate/bicarbonate transport system ATPase subunit
MSPAAPSTPAPPVSSRCSSPVSKGRYTILLVTHNLAQARRLADTVAVCWVSEVRLRGRIRTVRRALRTCRAPHHAGLLRGEVR